MTAWVLYILAAFVVVGGVWFALALIYHAHQRLHDDIDRDIDDLEGLP